MTSLRPLRFSHRVTYVFARGGLLALSILPERLAYGATAFLARMFLWFQPRRVRLGLENLALAYPDVEGGPSAAERMRTVRGGVASAFQNVVDLALVNRWMRRGRLRERVDVTAVESNRPVGAYFGLTLHLGSWEVAAAAAATVVPRVDVIGRLPRNPLFAGYLRRQREAFGVFVHARRGAMRPIARALAEGSMVVHGVDQNQRLRGVFAPFFGRLAASERGAATLAVRRGYPIVLGVCVRTAVGFHFKVVTTPPIEISRTGDLEADVQLTVTRINAAAETLVRLYPDQYLWIHDRYRTRPPEEGGGVDRHDDD